MIKKLTKEADIKAGLKLVTAVFDTFQAPDYGPDGVASFKNFIDFQQLYPQLTSGKISLYGYFVNQQIVGLLGIRNPNHICLLFVAEAYHRKGIARKLFANWLQEHSANLTTVTVNSSPYALAAYQKLGFEGDTTVIETDGIKFIPLTLTLNTRN
ncbi:GNAT family N-acetyltransferase [Enterococcus sp. HY326]|uniref:GNAT family N-acetyltransferase n=1 Tax=Enterococcus sp. HY326 TaxID=2971265 RepID=UPI00223F24CB|nr:GNAT family N-acetyltransferase [Enterococcus sp. HY326]